MEARDFCKSFGKVKVVLPYGSLDLYSTENLFPKLGQEREKKDCEG